MKKIKAFTLVETLIVIVVFCVGILVVLQGLSQTLKNKDYANTQIKSAFFAREGIELLFNLRDANYHKELEWNCIFEPIEVLETDYDESTNPFCKDYLGVGSNNILKIGIGSADEYIHIESEPIEELEFDYIFDNYQIYLHTGNASNSETGFRYDYDPINGEKTGFARYLLVTGVLAEDGTIVNKDKLLKIESHVLYKRGALTGEKVMETFIGNYEF